MTEATIIHLMLALGVSRTRASRLAKAEGWPYRWERCQGGRRKLYPVDSLPARARNALAILPAEALEAAERRERRRLALQRRGYLDRKRGRSRRRICEGEDCGRDISHRHLLARFCRACAAERKRESHKAAMRERRATQAASGPGPRTRQLASPAPRQPGPPAALTGAAAHPSRYALRKRPAFLDLGGAA